MHANARRRYCWLLLVLQLMSNAACRCPRKFDIVVEPSGESIAGAIRVSIERAIVHSDGRVMARTGLAIQNAPMDVAFEVQWLELGMEAFGVLWVRKGEDSSFLPTRMLLPPNYPERQASQEGWPPRRLRSVDVLLRSSPLALDHANMSEAWIGRILIEDVPLEWIDSN